MFKVMMEQQQQVQKQEKDDMPKVKVFCIIEYKMYILPTWLRPILKFFLKSKNLK